MASSSATPPDGNASGTSDDFGSFFLRLKFQVTMSEKMIKKLAQKTSGGDTSGDLTMEVALLESTFCALLLRIAEIVPRFMNRSPREMSIALKDWEKARKGNNLDALISRFEGFLKKLGEIEGEIRSLLPKSRGCCENYAWILYIVMGSTIHKDDLVSQLGRVQDLEDQVEKERLKSDMVAHKAELKEFIRRLGEIDREFSLWEIGDIGKEMGRLLKPSRGVSSRDIDAHKKRLRDFQNMMFPPGNQVLLDSCSVDEFRDKMCKFGKELNEIGEKVYLTGSELEEAVKKQNAKKVEENTKKNAIVISSDSSSTDDGNLEWSKEDDEPNAEADDSSTVEKKRHLEEGKQQNPTDGNLSGAKEDHEPDVEDDDDSSTGESAEKKRKI